jgi:hypothetical protein
MPLDGTEFEAVGDNRLAKLGEVERLLINEHQWCKGRLRDKDGRFCLAGAMQAVGARRLLDPIILRAAREVGGKRYGRIESFNDNPYTTHEDVLRVLQRARQNIIAGMIEGNPGPWYQRWARALRILCSARKSAISAALRPAMRKSLPAADASAARFIGSQNDESSSTLCEICEISR